MSDTERLPPHSRDAERAVLGLILHHNEVLGDLAPMLRPEHFYPYGHRVLYKAMLGLHASGGPIDFVTLCERLKTNAADLADVGGHAYVVDLWDAAPGGAGSAPRYVEIILDRAMRRDLIQATNQIQEQIFDIGTPAIELVQQCEKRMVDLAEIQGRARLRNLRELGDEYLIEMDRRSGRNDTGEASEASVSTGWRDLDKLTAGLFQDELTIVAARPSKGKTLFAGCMARSIAGRGNRVFMASLEQRDREIYSRLISAEAGIPSQRLRGGYLDDGERDRMIDARLRLDDVAIWIDDTPAQTTMQIGATARRLMKQGLRLVVIDYLQLVQPENRHEPRHEQVGGVARHLKLLARELHVPVVALAQVGRSAENRPDQRPRLADLKESGGIEEHADCVMLLHKPESDDKYRTTDTIEVIVEKCRNGPTGTVFMLHDRQHFTVKERDYEP